MTPAPLALSMGEPAGIGPEIIVAAWRALRGRQDQTFAVVGDSRLLAAQGADVVHVTTPGEALANADRLAVIHRPANVAVQPGRPDPDNASAIAGWIVTAVDFAMAGQAGGVVTAPIAKAPLYAAGFAFPGHTEFIADLTADAAWPGMRGPVMMLTAADLRTVLVTIHTPLARVAEQVTAERVTRTVRVTHEALQRDFGIPRPRLALAGLNPHAGEDGTIGSEEVAVLRPAVAALRGDGVDITGPLPADTLFHADARARYDAVVCLYHDQALIPVKTLDFWGGVNATLGLPVVRTSPDHGVGLDIAGKGAARPDSLIAAIGLAAEMAARRIRT